MPELCATDIAAMRRALYSLFISDERRFSRQMVYFITSIRKRNRGCEGQAFPPDTLHHKLRRLSGEGCACWADLADPAGGHGNQLDEGHVSGRSHSAACTCAAAMAGFMAASHVAAAMLVMWHASLSSSRSRAEPAPLC